MLDRIGNATMTRTLGELWEDLRRRRVVRVAAAYLIVAYAAVQVANEFFPTMPRPLASRTPSSPRWRARSPMHCAASSRRR